MKTKYWYFAIEKLSGGDNALPINVSTLFEVMQHVSISNAHDKEIVRGVVKRLVRLRQ
jgi:hypothetical protein